MNIQKVKVRVKVLSFISPLNGDKKVTFYIILDSQISRKITVKAVGRLSRYGSFPITPFLLGIENKSLSFINFKMNFSKFRYIFHI